MTVLVTGGTGALGSEVVKRLLAGGADVRITSRRADATAPDGVEVVQANLGSGEGFERAVDGADAIVHLATSFTRSHADVDGTAQLLAKAKRAGVVNFLFTSIVGIDREPIGSYPYYRTKLETERVVEASGVPWTILRATQFHSLALRALQASDRLPWQWIVSDARFQLVDPGDVAEHVIDAIEGRAKGRLPDIAGPKEESMETIARAYMRHRGSRKPLLKTWIDFGFGRGFVAGQNLAPADRQVGKVSWEDFLSLRPVLRAAA
ncbi:MAG TPA: NAD(P)H-binding protein [Candidatus Dormibacteraeota bacterium]|jgi:uncharacterized protein YbjT (DUF2867 family)|nr:NAD(P)H-binding protein [Candidatus Dormibacteraeota bacterium]